MELYEECPCFNCAFREALNCECDVDPASTPDCLKCKYEDTCQTRLFKQLYIEGDR